VANAAANSGASVETEPSINPARPRLHILQQEHAPPRLVFLGADVGAEDFAGEFHCALFVGAFPLRRDRRAGGAH
jgi:hypothetical protein